MNMSTKVSRVALCAAAVATVVGMTGCSAHTAKKTAEGAAKVAVQPLAALQRATDSTEKYGSADVDMATSVSGSAPTRMAGTYSWGNGLSFDVSMDAKAAGMTKLVSGQYVNMLLVHGAYYYNVAPQPSGPLKGKHWMKVDASAVLGEQASSAMNSSADPTQGLQSLKYARNAKEVGKETVLGREATHYHATLSKDDLGAAGSALGSKDKKELLQQFTGAVDAITFDVWVDSHDMPVRMKEDIGAMNVSIDFKKFGPAKSLRAPAASDTADMTDAVRQQTGQTGQTGQTDPSGQTAG
ncbi:hypothetical protein OG760_11245 [Streptomyces sp. NBC_00963]|uniref:hypothetical protein n=1 Tax=Streptomyces sp. NBC_00963 TaxID=2903697 RepID=UPI00386C6BB7|nr:hypothetical protein OG760_11245 [Streptomyces sp. NBC_00963]